jgi:hypothetical protein
MAGKKQEKSKQTEHFSTCSTPLLCHECNRTVGADLCGWEEDDEGRIFCQECRAVKESCGCSD